MEVDYTYLLITNLKFQSQFHPLLSKIYEIPERVFIRFKLLDYNKYRHNIVRYKLMRVP